MWNVYILLPLCCRTLVHMWYRAVLQFCLMCARRETGVDAMRANVTFLWMSDPLHNFPFNLKLTTHFFRLH